MKSKSTSQVGYILIEALVAILVLSVGTFGVVKLNSALLQGGGQSKTRAEALQLAQTRIEALMTLGATGTCPAAGSTSSSTETASITGLNATYRAGQDQSNATTERFSATVYIAWDGSTDPRNAPADKKIEMRTVVACNTAGTSGQIGGDASKLNAQKIKTPTGVARVGGRLNPTCPTGSCVQVAAGTSNMQSDGLSIYKTGNLVELVDPSGSGKVLLTIEDGSDFSSISGRVYIQTASNGQPIINPQGSDATDPSDDLLFVLSSDAAYCSRIFPTNPVPPNSSGTSQKYTYFDYNCYVSKGWWGNIGIVEVGTRGQDEKICVGDKAVSSTETNLFSRKAALSISRGYRGFRNNGTSGSTNLLDYETVGIGYALVNNTVSSSYQAVHIGTYASGERSNSLHHDFLVATITGQGTCENSGVMTRVGTNASNEFTKNVGKFYCMSQCPPLSPTNSVQTTVVHGTITKRSGGVLTGIDSADCQTTPVWTEDTASGTYTYSCTKTWTGFAGSSWDGGVTFLTSGTNTTCANSNGSAPVVTPSSLTVASTVNARNATNNKNSLSFTDVQIGVTDVRIDLEVHGNACLTLGIPALRWSTSPGGTSDASSATSMKYISWDAIVGASSYDIRSCNLTANATSCVPSAVIAVIDNVPPDSSTASYLPATSSITSSTKGICFTATAKASGLNQSSASAVKCVSGAPGGVTTYSFN